jgi:hypothetical protein
MNMNADQLADFLDLPDVHRRILSGYVGPYSLGVGRRAENGDDPVLLLHVQGHPSIPFPQHVSLGGAAVPVVVVPDFVAPQAFASTES